MTRFFTKLSFSAGFLEKSAVQSRFFFFNHPFKPKRTLFSGSRPLFEVCCRAEENPLRSRLFFAAGQTKLCDLQKRICRSNFSLFRLKKNDFSEQDSDYNFVFSLF